MRNPRIYQNQQWQIGDIIDLDNDAFGHTVRVLRLSDGDAITLFNGQKFNGRQFNGQGVNNEFGEFNAELKNVSKKSAQAKILSFTQVNNESPVNIHLGQTISRGDRMDFTLQKSVELGVNTITPLFSERCGVKISGERLDKKIAQWQRIVISACEQSGRCTVPEVKAAEQLNDWLKQDTSALKLNLHPRAQHSIISLPQENQRVRLLIGPEGGLSDEEITQASQHDFVDVLLGPRVLRTETAALTAITALQCRYGDIK